MTYSRPQVRTRTRSNREVEHSRHTRAREGDERITRAPAHSLLSLMASGRWIHERYTHSLMSGAAPVEGSARAVSNLATMATIMFDSNPLLSICLSFSIVERKKYISPSRIHTHPYANNTMRQNTGIKQNKNKQNN